VIAQHPRTLNKDAALPLYNKGMCGRFVRAKSRAVYEQAFDVSEVPSLLSYNVAPTQPVAAVRTQDDRKACVLVRWGMIPSWAKDSKTSYINARSETLLEKPAFRTAFQRRRCLVLADGYYEWKTEGKIKTPYYFRPADDQPVALAGFWDCWKKQAEPIESCAIITTNANELARPIHDRMPVLLRGTAAEAWLDPEVADPQALLALLVPFPASEMICYPVPTIVNSPKNNAPECIARI
jgi:putative SOS response-associated peptidase YedK